MESLAEIRRRAQEPVAPYNDVAGQLVGDRLSLPVTALFLRLGIGPTVATLSMLWSGLLGSALTAFGGWWSVAGFALVFAYYIFDCVDGEVARFHGCEKLIWGYHDFMFHLYVKSAFFVCVGVGATHTTGSGWVLGFALAALLATLFQKFLHDLPLALTCRQVLLKPPAERERFLREVVGEPRPEDLRGAALGDEPTPFRFSGLSGLRAALTNFDLAVLFFLAAAVLDRFFPPWTLSGVPLDLVTVLLVYYGLALPLDFLDRLQDGIRGGHFYRDARALLLRASDFRVDR